MAGVLCTRERGSGTGPARGQGGGRRGRTGAPSAAALMRDGAAYAGDRSLSTCSEFTRTGVSAAPPSGRAAARSTVRRSSSAASSLAVSSSWLGAFTARPGSRGPEPCLRVPARAPGARGPRGRTRGRRAPPPGHGNHVRQSPLPFEIEAPGTHTLFLEMMAFTPGFYVITNLRSGRRSLVFALAQGLTHGSPIRAYSRRPCWEIAARECCNQW